MACTWLKGGFGSALTGFCQRWRPRLSAMGEKPIRASGSNKMMPRASDGPTLATEHHQGRNDKGNGEGGPNDEVLGHCSAGEQLPFERDAEGPVRQRKLEQDQEGEKQGEKPEQSPFKPWIMRQVGYEPEQRHKTVDLKSRHTIQ